MVNLVREQCAKGIAEDFSPHLMADGPVQFSVATWEGLFLLPVLSGPEASPLRAYLSNKTMNLSRVFPCLDPRP